MYFFSQIGVIYIKKIKGKNWCLGISNYGSIFHTCSSSTTASFSPIPFSPFHGTCPFPRAAFSSSPTPFPSNIFCNRKPPWMASRYSYIDGDACCHTASPSCSRSHDPHNGHIRSPPSSSTLAVYWCISTVVTTATQGWGEDARFFFLGWGLICVSWGLYGMEEKSKNNNKKQRQLQLTNLGLEWFS